jgi:hypothetical protein
MEYIQRQKGLDVYLSSKLVLKVKEVKIRVTHSKLPDLSFFLRFLDGLESLLQLALIGLWLSVHHFHGAVLALATKMDIYSLVKYD